VTEHRSVGLLEDVLANLDDEIRTNPDDVAVEGSVMQLAQRDAVGNDGITAWLPVRNDVGSIEQLFVPELGKVSMSVGKQRAHARGTRPDAVVA
jgi:hypothetical protein